jgi:predicted TIM-barrel fold metal-dependent hydrolase
MFLLGAGGVGLAGSVALSPATAAPARAARPTTPACDHHQHLLSPMAAAREWEPKPGGPVEPPAEIAALVAARQKAWNDPKALEPLFTEDAALLDPDEHSWIRGRKDVAEYIGGRFARPYRFTAMAVSVEGGGALLAGYYTRGEGAAAKHIGAVQLSLVKGADGAWRIAAESPAFPGPGNMEPIDAAKLVALLDEIWIDRAVVLSLAYWYGSPLHAAVADELAKVRAENDWTAEQCARFPGRLTAFCSVNPLKEYALEEIGRCAKSGRFRGLKLHFGNSRVDAKSPDHIARLKQVMAAANAYRLGVVAHLWTSEGYGAPEAQSFLDNLLPAAPDVAVQIAHMAGGGPGWTDPALEVFADAVARGDPRTRNLYFDVATVADLQKWDDLKLLAQRIRQIGLKRILYGSDAAFGGRSTPRVEWGNFRGTVPLSDAEFKVIAANVAPYLRT